MLATVPVFRISAAAVVDTRVYSGVDKTRITIQLDGPAQYQTQLTSEPGLSISLLKTGLGAIKKTTSINDEMVKGMTLKEIAGSIVDINISLKGDANFAVFPLESPDRIVIDIMPVDIMPVEATETAPLSVEHTSGPAAKDSSSADSDNSDVGADPNPDAVENGLISSILPFQAKDYMLAQLILNVVLVIALIIMGIKLWSIAKASKKNHKVLKKSQDFADIIGGLQQQSMGKNSTVGVLHSAAAQLEAPDRSLKRTKKKRRGARTASLQEQYRKVSELAQLGLDRLAISQQSNVPIGEVNLILDLSKTRQQVGEIRG